MLFFERLMYIDGVTPINCVMTTRIRGSFDPDHLRTALDKIQAKHTLLRARVVVEGSEPWLTFDEGTPSIPVRIIERQTAEDWQVCTVEEWKRPFNTAAGPLLRIIWVGSKEISELMFVAHHCICDGGSMVTLIRETLQVMDKPETELTAYRPYSSIEDLVPASILRQGKAVARVRRKAALYRLFLALVARRPKPLAAGEPYALYWQADAAYFHALTVRCTAENTSLYAALCVAFLQAFRHVQGKAARNKLMCPVNIRRLVPAVTDEMLFAFAPTIALSLGKSKEADLWTRAREITGSIKSGIKTMNAYEDLMMGEQMRGSVPRLLNFLRSSRGGHDLAFSNVGRIKMPSTYGTFTLEGTIGTTVAVPWRNTNTVTMTFFHGVMELAFISNERFLPRVEASAIQQYALRLMQEAMQLPGLLKKD